MKNNGIIQDIRFIVLTRDKFAIVDSEDIDRISKFKWHYTTTGYAMRMVYLKRRIPNVIEKYSQPMARKIMGVPAPTQVDHISTFRLDNRKINLRICNFSQNGGNRNKRRNLTSIYKGVCFDKKNGSWVAYITINYKYKFLGYFTNEVKAAKVYDKKARELFGEFARTNFSDK